MIQGAELKEGAIVLDVGVARLTDPETGNATLAGDVDASAADAASCVPPSLGGGVGPMSRAMQPNVRQESSAINLSLGAPLHRRVLP